MTKPKVRYLTVSDIHLGHDRNPTKSIVGNLRSCFHHFSDASEWTKLDLIVIVGDLFDHLVDISGHDFYDTLDFLVPLARFCKRHDIILRFLEGTPYHDRRQNRLIEAITMIQQNEGNIRWVNTLEIEYLPTLDLNILYIPDEFTASAEITLGMVKDLMREKDLTQVDIAMMHGMFAYQMEGIPGNHDVHDQEEYLRLVKHFISIGHIHTHSNYRRIIAQGSFDRLSHGEEGPKGFVVATIRDEDSDYFEFIENKGAKIFKTIELKTMDLDKALKQLDSQLSKLPKESHVRIKAPKLSPIFAYLPELKKDFLYLHFSKLSIEEEAELKKSQQASNEVSYSVIEIRPDNVVDLLLNELTTQVPVHLLDKVLITNQLEALVD